MPVFEVNITGSFKRKIEVEAENTKEAFNQAVKDWNSGDVCVDIEDDINDVDFEVVEDFL